MTRQDLIRIRKASGLSQTKFAKAVGLSGGFISQLENGVAVISDTTVQKYSSFDAGKPIVEVEPQGEPMMNILGTGKVPITIRLPNGYEIIVNGSLKQIVRQVKNL